MPINSYSLAAGYSGSPTNVESISVASGEDLRPFYSKLTVATYYFVATDTFYTIPYIKSAGGSYTQSGYASFTWVLPLVGVTSYKYLMDTYAQESSSQGRVTVGSRSDAWGVYDDYNADMFLEPVIEPVYCRNGVDYFRNVRARFLIKETA